MRPLRFLLLLPGLFLLVASLPAQDTQPVNTEAILRELAAIEKQRAQIVLAAKQAAIAKLQPGVTNGNTAVNLYTDAMEAVEYEGKPNKAAAFTDWKNTNADLFRSHEFEALMMLQLKYLVLSLQRGDAKDAVPFLTPALAYAREIFEADATFLKQNQRLAQITANKQPSPREREELPLLQKVIAAKAQLLDQSLAASVFTKWLHLGPWLPSAANWELTPGNLSGILARDLRPTLREQKNVQLMDSWTFEMQFLANRAIAGRLDQTAGDFDNVVRPQLIFNKANDMVLLGWNNRAITEIYTLLKTYPQHADFDLWTARLKDLINQLSAPVPAESPLPDASSTPMTGLSPSASMTPAGTAPR